MLDQANFLTMQSQSMLTQEQKDMETLLNAFTENIDSQQDQNFSQDDNVVPKKKEKKDYSNTKVKMFLTEDLNNQILKKTVSLLIFYHF